VELEPEIIDALDGDPELLHVVELVIATLSRSWSSASAREPMGGTANAVEIDPRPK
jgi:hypothetical protein